MNTTPNMLTLAYPTKEALEKGCLRVMAAHEGTFITEDEMCRKLMLLATEDACEALVAEGRFIRHPEADGTFSYSINPETKTRRE